MDAPLEDQPGNIQRKILFHLQEVTKIHLPFSQKARRSEFPFRMALFIFSLQQAPFSCRSAGRSPSSCRTVRPCAKLKPRTKSTIYFAIERSPCFLRLICLREPAEFLCLSPSITDLSSVTSVCLCHGSKCRDPLQRLSQAPSGRTAKNITCCNGSTAGICISKSPSVKRDLHRCTTRRCRCGNEALAPVGGSRPAIAPP